jgi:AbrB family looped-hinge helix DNA binding protein
METEFTKLSSRGQIVIPQGIREEMGLMEGAPLAISHKKNVIVLRALELPDMEKELDKVFSLGKDYARKKGIKPSDVQKAIDKIR